VVVETSGSLLVVDLSNRVFRLSRDRLSLVAGSGAAGPSGDGGPAVRAAIGFPVEAAIDPRGGFGIVHDERRIHHVDEAGTIRTVAEFQQPTALAYDAAGNLFVSELLGCVKRRDATTGAITEYAGFNRPHGLAVASGETRAILLLTSTRYSIAAGLGAVWSAECGPIVNRLDLRTGRATTAVTRGDFSYVFTAAGSIWAADDRASAPVRYDSTGRRVVATVPTGNGTSALVEEAGSLWIVNHRDGTLQRIDPATNAAVRLARLPGDAPEHMTYAEGRSG
jgi:sugar lactone lactonase YvrE